MSPRLWTARSNTIHPAYLDLPAATSKAQTKHACSYIVEAVKASPDKVTLVPVGPPTNVGMALRMDCHNQNNSAVNTYVAYNADKAKFFDMLCRAVAAQR